MKNRIKIGTKYFTMTSDDDYLKHMGSEFEPNMAKLFQSLIEPEDIVADVGANIGMTAILFSELASKVYAFEPSPTTFSILKNNLDLAQTSNVEAHNIGFGNHQETLTITFATNNRSGGFVSDKIQPSSGHITENISIDTFDSWFAQDIQKPTFLKIDVEGFEQNVIKGGQQFISRHRPTAVMEMNHFCLDVLQRITIPDFLDFMRSVFPNLFAVDADNSVVADLHVKDEAYMVMHEHVVKNRFPNIVGSFDQKIISKLHQLSQETSSIINPAATDRTSHTVSRPLSTPKGRLVADKNIDVQPDRNESFLIPVHLFNESDETWHTNGSHPVHLSYHWMDAKSNHVVFDGIRTKLKCGSLPPGCTTEEVIHIQAPDKPGDYKLALTLVQEGVCWFEDRGFTCQFLNLSVK